MPDTEQTTPLLDLDPAGDAVEIVDTLLAWGVREGATDLHLSAHLDGHLARARVDGQLRDLCVLPGEVFQRVVARVKVLAEADLAEHRRPQDRRFTASLGDHEVDFRVSVLPTHFGESVALRILDRSSGLLDMHQLGFTRRELAQVRSLLAQRGGLIVVSGPAGAGKTTTLYAALMELGGPERSIVTIEDPVEYEVARASQTSIRPDIGVTFPTLLRSVLRHDPDVILVGEIRDPETAQIAIRAALTGHLVLTSLHTRRAADTIIALQQLGARPYALAPALRGVIAQQLVALVCPACKTTFEYGEEVLADPDFARARDSDKPPSFSVGMGCDQCFSKGYRGRRGIFEILEVDEQIRRCIYDGKSAAEIEAAAVESGMLTLRQKGFRAVLDGDTTVEEVVSQVTMD